MSAETYIKLKRELKKELFEELSDLIIRISKDPEGEYRPEFVRKIRTIAEQKGPTFLYNKKTFGKLIA